jgi:hypothetical protein
MSPPTNQKTTSEVGRSRLLRRALLANACFSGLSGIVILLTEKPLALVLGAIKPSDLSALAISLIFFSAVLFRATRSANVSSIGAWIFVLLDMAWVIGSAAVILAGVLTVAGNWIVGLVADVVLLFAALQFIGIRKLRPTPEG